MNELKFNSGVPTTIEYCSMLQNKNFLSVENYSNQFLSKHKSSLDKYPWSKDPLHSWSRQWEYPFVSERISEYADVSTSNNENINILDAGSGVTFFPYYLSSKEQIDITCCDYDDRWNQIYSEINSNHDSNVHFKSADLRTVLPFDDSEFDVVYCISVLEHTGSYDSILKEFKRVLKPGGLIIITFDISLDGNHDIDTQEAINLLNTINNNLKLDINCNYYVNSIKQLSEDAKKYLTTNFIEKFDINLLPCPWNETPMQSLKRILKTRSLIKKELNLSVMCLTASKLY
jgi:ubiquinone/menaquinone biosynthesis C-methylase UbiE